MTARVQVKMNVSWAWPIDVTPAAAEPHLGLYSPFQRLGGTCGPSPAQAKNRWEMQTATPSQGGAIVIAYYLSVPAQLKFSTVSEVSKIPRLRVWVPNLADTLSNAGIPQAAHCNQCSF